MNILTKMKIEKYPTQSNANKSIFSFTSIGRNVIEKRVQFTQINDIENYGLPKHITLYNLAFGDWNEESEDIDDFARSNNGDTETVLATVANTVREFRDYHPDSLLFITGSTSERNRLYQIAISKNLNEILNEVTIYGLTNYSWEEYSIGNNYDAFLIINKRNLLY